MLSNGLSGEARSKLDEIELADDGLGDGVSLDGLLDRFWCIFIFFLSSFLRNKQLFLFVFDWGGESSVLTIQEVIRGKDPEERWVVAENRTRRIKSNMDGECNH